GMAFAGYGALGAVLTLRDLGGGGARRSVGARPPRARRYRCRHRGGRRPMIAGTRDAVFRSTSSALERVPNDARRRAWSVLEDLTRRIPRAALTAPIGGRLPLLRPEVSRERLGRAVGNKRVLLTGASSGIGLETAYAIARAQGRVILVARGEERLREVASQIRALGGTVDMIAADLSYAGDAETVVAAVR